MNRLKEVFICGARRTAIGSFMGSLSTVPATELGIQVIKALLSDSKLPADAVGEVVIGAVLSAGMGQAPARQVVVNSGLSPHTQAMTINKVCSSGLKAVQLAAQSLIGGDHEVAVAGGIENMSLAPYLAPSMRRGARLGNSELQDSILRDALWDVYNDFHMGNAAELCARTFKLDRETQDRYAAESYTRALNAIAAGHFKAEIVPVSVREGKKEVLFDTDEEPSRGQLDRFSSLKPAFDKEGTVTAANASSINDGAALLLLATESGVKKFGLAPLARIVSFGWHGQEPEWFTVAPVGAVQSCLARAGLQASAVDLFEINEAFSAVALACSRKLDVPGEKLNINGGAVALGHPVGASGARIVTTLLHSLRRRKEKIGVAAICNGGGEATAMAIECLS